LHVARETHDDVFGWTKIEPRGQCPGDHVFDVFGRDGSASARNDDVAYATGGYTDERMATDGLKYGIG
jgi:hypothetical protein